MGAAQGEQQGGDVGWVSQVPSTQVFVRPRGVVEDLESGVLYSFPCGL